MTPSEQKTVDLDEVLDNDRKNLGLGLICVAITLVILGIVAIFGKSVLSSCGIR